MATQKYEYTPLAWRRQIRLLRLYAPAGPDDSEVCVDLVPVSLDSAPPFNALSYAWGDPLPRHKIRCSGRTAEIGPSLYNALYHQRLIQDTWKTHWMWADALCINQEDIAEREAQVRIMGDIYSAAEVTMIWLGEEDDYVTRAFDWIRRFSNTWRLFKIRHNTQQRELQAILSANGRLEASAILRVAFGDESNQHKASQDIWRLLGRPWFERKWVIQEVFKSKHHAIVLIAGGKWTHWGYFISWFAFLQCDATTRTRVFLSCPWESDIDRHDDMSARDIMTRGTTLSQAFFSDLPLSYILADTLIFKCSNPSDQIIALLGIASDASIFKNLIDYNVPTGELYYRLTCAYLTNSLRLRALWSIHSMIPVDRRRKASWIPNIEELDSKSVSRMSNLTKSPRRLANACGSTDIETSTSGNKLLIRGRIVDLVEQLGTDMTAFPELFRSHPATFTPEHKGIRSLLMSWSEECQTIAESSNEDEDGFINTMLIDNFLSDRPAEIRARAKQDFFTCQRINKLLLDALDEPTFLTIMNSIDWETRRSMNFIDGFHMAMIYRRFGRTLHGKIGWMPLVVEEWDHICVFDGMEFPYVVRQRENGNYALVGECFIPSLFNGEAMEMPGVESEIITIE